jgi:uncharacterized protein YdaU (DUF1376 family)
MGLCWLLTSLPTIIDRESHLGLFLLEKAMHYYQFNIGDYVSHTAHLTNDEDLTYRRLLDLYYQTEKSFDVADLPKVARKVKSNEETVMLILHEFFEFNTNDNSWHNKRADSEIKSYQSKADSARKANQIRWGSERHLKSDTSQILNIKQETINNIEELKPKKKVETKETQFPDDYVPNDKHYQLAKELNININQELLKFSDYHKSKGSKFKSWDYALNTWLRNAADFKRPSVSTPVFDGRLRGAK